MAEDKGGFGESVVETEKRLKRGLPRRPEAPEPGRGRIPEMDMSAPPDRRLGGTQQRDRTLRQAGVRKGK